MMYAITFDMNVDDFRNIMELLITSLMMRLGMKWRTWGLNGHMEACIFPPMRRTL